MWGMRIEWHAHVHASGLGAKDRPGPASPTGGVITIMHKTGPFTNSGVSKFVKLVVVYNTKHQQLNNTKNYIPKPTHNSLSKTT